MLGAEITRLCITLGGCEWAALPHSNVPRSPRRSDRNTGSASYRSIRALPSVVGGAKMIS